MVSDFLLHRELNIPIHLPAENPTWGPNPLFPPNPIVRSIWHIQNSARPKFLARGRSPRENPPTWGPNPLFPPNPIVRSIWHIQILQGRNSWLEADLREAGMDFFNLLYRSSKDKKGIFVNYDEKQQSRVMVNYLQCNGLLSPDDHCLERLSCEFGDPANEKAPELERTVTSM
ncbi:uncharacterized protein CEXT_315371 [Caerostris extrusa]|uniref:Uncharacterized protein n=1 Tax=Caerostris extrusa TaxID=172846 RepID=A0AAV4QHV2_CAEEX|nr:uncharacterized protein CEXT_315371 [Caerostris extrusa]